MIKLNGVEYKSIDECRHLFATAEQVEIRNELNLVELPETPVATKVQYYNLPMVTQLPETPLAIEVQYYNLPLVTQLPETPVIWRILH